MCRDMYSWNMRVGYNQGCWDLYFRAVLIAIPQHSFILSGYWIFMQWAKFDARPLQRPCKLSHRQSLSDLLRFWFKLGQSLWKLSETNLSLWFLISIQSYSGCEFEHLPIRSPCLLSYWSCLGGELWLGQFSDISVSFSLGEALVCPLLKKALFNPIILGNFT